jgi:cellobiose phosphorylase
MPCPAAAAGYSYKTDTAESNTYAAAAADATTKQMQRNQTIAAAADDARQQKQMQPNACTTNDASKNRCSRS